MSITIDAGVTISAGITIDPVGPAPVPSATGGTITSLTVGSTNYRVHTFSVGTSTFALDLTRTVEYLVVGGGGGGGTGIHAPDHYGWPGYGGAVSTGTVTLAGGDYSVSVGSGGSGGVNNPLNPPGNRYFGNTGTSSTFYTVVSPGGLGGQAVVASNGTNPPDNSVASSITGTSVTYGTPGAVTVSSVVGTSYSYPAGHGGDGGGLGNFSGGAGAPGIVVIRYTV